MSPNASEPTLEDNRTQELTLRVTRREALGLYTLLTNNLPEGGSRHTYSGITLYNTPEEGLIYKMLKQIEEGFNV